MRITIQIWIIGIVIALASSISFAQGKQKQMLALYGAETATQLETPAARDADTATSKRAAPISLRDQRLFQQVTRASQTEFMASRMAEARATDPAVREFARDTARKHTRAVGQLDGFAQRKQIALSLQPTDAQQKMLEELNALSGEAFDQRYIREAGIKAHEDTLGLLKRVQKKGQDEELKLLAEALQATVATRMDVIRALASVD